MQGNVVVEFIVIIFFKIGLVRLITAILYPFLAKWRGKFYQLMAVWWPAWKELEHEGEHNWEKWSHLKMWHHSLAPAGTLGIESELYSQPWIFPSRLPLWLTRGQCAVMVSTVSCIGCFLWKIRGRQQAMCPLHGILNIEKYINYHISYNVKSF